MSQNNIHFFTIIGHFMLPALNAHDLIWSFVGVVLNPAWMRIKCCVYNTMNT